MTTPAASATRTDTFAAARRVIAGGVSSVMRTFEPELVMTRASGASMWDEDGREYLDFHAAFGPIVLGHAHEEVDGRVANAARTMDLTGVGPSLAEVELAERLVGHIPSAERVLFCNSGSEATYHAIRLARAATGRRRLIKFQGGYHGWHDSVSANVISPRERVGALDPTTAGACPQELADLIVLPFNDVDAFRQAMRDQGDDVAAIIVEPVLHTIGCVVGSDSFLTALREESRRHGSVLIFDEVVTGFRHALGGYQSLCGVTPDLTTLAKSMANGYPIAAVVGASELMEQFAPAGGPVMFGGTFSGHPVMAAASVATLDVLERDDGAFYRHVDQLGERMRLGLVEVAARVGIEMVVQQFRSVFACYFGPEAVRTFVDTLDNDAGRYVGFHRGMIDRGFFMVPLNLKRNHLSLAHTEEDVDRTIEAAEQVLSELAARA